MRAEGPMRIVEITEVSDELVAALERLIPQLDPEVAAPTRGHLERMVASPACALLVAREEGEDRAILGCLTLVWYPIPTGLRAWIEDVVVDRDARGRGIGEALMREAMTRAAGLGATKLDLTSRPSREAADRLYRRLGFQLRDTRVYRYLHGGTGTAERIG
jgi:ribosomal protein S18 acetylase RimI-like enzyme